jgi:hypothetical protein
MFSTALVSLADRTLIGARITSRRRSVPTLCTRFSTLLGAALRLIILCSGTLNLIDTCLIKGIHITSAFDPKLVILKTRQAKQKLGQ